MTEKLRKFDPKCGSYTNLSIWNEKSIEDETSCVLPHNAQSAFYLLLKKEWKLFSDEMNKTAKIGREWWVGKISVPFLALAPYLGWVQRRTQHRRMWNRRRGVNSTPHDMRESLVHNNDQEKRRLRLYNLNTNHED